jgi:predicted DNA-binding protein (MmcQ/YjbR family)
MDIEWIRQHCLSLPHTTEQVQWHSDLVFKVGGKMYAVAPTEPAPVFLSFKCSDETFADLIERPGIIPAPYLARAKWVALQNEEALPRAELRRLLSESYELVSAKLPRATRATLAQTAPQASGRRANPRRRTRRR